MAAPAPALAPASAPGPVRVKVCGLAEPGAVAAAAEAGAAYLGFVFFPRSPRAVTPARARALAAPVPAGVARVGLFVDPTDADLLAVLDAVPLDAVQLHGRERPERVGAVRALAGLPVVKAVGVSGPGDLAAALAYGEVADQLLLDARPPPGADRPGGHGAAFDWDLLAGWRPPVPWLLAGGLTPANVAEAIRRTGARQVDASSGVERSPGVKDPALVRAFVRAALAA